MTEATKKVIARLKEVKTQKEMSCQDIANICDQNGEPISLSSIKRIFAKGSEDGKDYRAYTLNAIFHAVIGTEEVELSAEDEEMLSDTCKEIMTENAALKAVIELNEKHIEELNAIIANLESSLTEMESEKDTMMIQLETTTEMFRIAMESIGKSLTDC